MYKVKTSSNKYHQNHGIVIYARGNIHVLGYDVLYNDGLDAIKESGWKPYHDFNNVWVPPNDRNIMAWYDERLRLWCVGRRFTFRPHALRTRNISNRLFQKSHRCERFLPLAIRVLLRDIGTRITQPGIPTRSETVLGPIPLNQRILGRRAHMRVLATKRNYGGKVDYSMEIHLGKPFKTREETLRKGFYLPDYRRVPMFRNISKAITVRQFVEMIDTLIDKSNEVAQEHLKLAPELRYNHLPKIAKLVSYNNGTKYAIDFYIHTVFGKERYMAYGYPRRIQKIQSTKHLKEILANL